MNKDCRSCIENCAECANAKLLYIYKYLFSVCTTCKPGFYLNQTTKECQEC